MSEIYDVVVVGAGIEGSGSAYYSALQGNRTLLLEQFPLPHSRGSSHGQTRAIRMGYIEDYHVRMMVQAYKMWETLETQEDIKLITKTGFLTFGIAPSKQVNDMCASLSKLKAKYERLDGSALAQKYPMFNLDSRFHGVFDPNGGVIKADQALLAFWPERIGVYYWKTKTDQFKAIQGMPTFSNSNLDEGPEVLVYGLPRLEYQHHIKFCMNAGEEIDPEDRDSEKALDTAKDIKLRLQDFVSKYIQTLEAKPTIVETCVQTLTPDHIAILDTHPKWKNIVIGAGFSGHGFKLAPVVGMVLTELATGRKPSFDLKPFAIDRFVKQSKL